MDVWENELRDAHGRWSTHAGATAVTSLIFNPDNPGPDFPETTAQAIRNYQGVWYHDINAPLRSGDKLGKEEAAVAGELDRVIAKSTVSKDAIVYRGMYDRPEGLVVGAKFQDNGFVSTSTNEDYVRRIFAEGEEAVVLHIQLPAGTHGIRLDTAEGNTFKEDELLLGRGATFDVLAEVPGPPGEPTTLIVQVV